MDGYGQAPTTRPASSGAAALLGPESNGCWCSVDNTVLPGALLRAGFDWVVLDAQHGEFDDRALRAASRALLGAGHRFAVRISQLDPAEIGRALDLGASTVIVPQVDSADQARAVVRAAHYPPVGTRSWGPATPTWGLPAPAPDAADPQVAVMIESAAALAEVETIAAVSGVDLVFVGPFDLALSLGVPLDALLQDREGPLHRIVAAARAAGVAVGAFAGTPDRARHLRAFGVDRLAVTTDVAVIAAGATTILGALPG